MIMPTSYLQYLVVCMCMATGHSAPTSTHNEHVVAARTAAASSHVATMPVPADPTGDRAAALQAHVDAVAAIGQPATIALTGTYNFSVSGRSLVIAGAACRNITLMGSGQDTTLLLFRGGGSLPPGQLVYPGVNFTRCVGGGLSSASIDYTPKPRGLLCNSRNNSGVLPPTPGCTPTGAGITLHMFDSDSLVMQDVTVFAAPYMAVTSFNGPGGHELHRVRFAINDPKQLFVAERDGVHESDVRRGIRVHNCTIGALNDDFFNVHSTLLIVLRCDPAPTRRCLVVNPHVEGGTLDTTYGTNSLLQGAVPGDTLSFFPFIPDASPKPSSLQRLGSATLASATRNMDPSVRLEAMTLSNSTHATNPRGAMAFAGNGHAVDVWTLTFDQPLTGPTPAPRTLVGVDNLSSAGSVLSMNVFNFTTCSARWKSPASMIVNNSFAVAGHNLEITYLQPWFEGPGWIDGVTVANNTFHYGVGVDPIHPNPIDTSNIHVVSNRFVQ
eukprot:m.203644 g.203644  ORF g.203644 m.203644 type:complete len:497 (+) comp22187_c0_seq1:145-1635(+)